MQVGLGGGLVYGQHSVDNGRCKLRRQVRVELGRERCSCDAEEEFTVDLLVELEAVEELNPQSGLLSTSSFSKSHLQSLLLGNLKTVGDDSRMQTLRDMSISLLEQLSHQQHH